MNVSNAVEGFSVVTALIEEGRFREASEQLRPLGTPRRIGERTIYELLRAELALELGDLHGALEACDRLAKEVDAEIVSQREHTRARASFLLGDYPRAMKNLQEARQAAVATGSHVRRARVELTGLILSSARQPIEATSSALSELKKLVAHTGNAHLMVELRQCVARAEARSNSLREAAKHLGTAESLLERYPNVWLSGTLELDFSIIATLNGDIEKALCHLQNAADFAARSGHFRTRAAALINLAQLSTDRGDYQKAKAHFDSVIKQCNHHPQLLLAALDGRANLFLTTGDHADAVAAFKDIRVLSAALGQARLHWDRVAESYSSARLAFSRKMWSEAEVELASALCIAKESHDTHWSRRIEMLRLKCIALRGDPRTASRELPTDSGPAYSIEMIARWHGTVATLYGSTRPESRSHLGRALRIAHGMGNNALAHDLQVGLPPIPELAEARPLATLDSAVALIEVAGHPEILAREAFALVDGSGCAARAALIARTAKTTQVLETRGWDERGALFAARKADTPETIDCGTRHDTTLHIIADPHDDLDRRCTWIAIKKLVVTALTLDRYRRDEKQRAALWPAESLDGDPDILWISEPIAEVVRVARRIGPTPLSVLLTGETGTGKEMLARTIHRSSDRADKILLAFNCTAVPRDMLESQLFGYRRGAFTGADTSFTGVIRAAEGGTLFLDEIADVPVDVQPKLLRFLETHEIHPLGEPHPIKVDVRVIAATNANLEQMVADGRFRQDLYYRLNVVRLRLPPLRERREEIPGLVDHYIRRYGDQQKKGRLTLSDDALEYLLLYTWPGNLRQLANEVNRMVAMADPDTALLASHLSAEIQATRRTLPASSAPDSELRISLDQSLPDAVELLERTMVQVALDKSKGRLEEAAKLLGISRKGLFLKRRRWGLRG